MACSVHSTYASPSHLAHPRAPRHARGRGRAGPSRGGVYSKLSMAGEERPGKGVTIGSVVHVMVIATYTVYVYVIKTIMYCLEDK